jgi:hypothetical protein
MMPQTQAAGKTKKEKETSTNKTNPKAAVKAQAKVPKKVAKKFK